jgi:ABC-type sugar transport system substrate-binding protein
MAPLSWCRNPTQKWGEHARWLSGEGTFAMIVPRRGISFFLRVTKGVADKAKGVGYDIRTTNREDEESDQSSY